MTDVGIILNRFPHDLRGRKILAKIAAAATAPHEGKIQRPPGQPQGTVTYINSRFRKGLRNGIRPANTFCRTRDIDPGLVIAADQIPARCWEPFQPGNRQSISLNQDIHQPFTAIHVWGQRVQHPDPSLDARVLAAVGLTRRKGHHVENMTRMFAARISEATPPWRAAERRFHTFRPSAGKDC